jgi:methylthioribulose-1-phosphate dehydratase
VTRHTAGIARALAETGQRLYARGWALGTSGNFSVVVSHDPLRLAMTASGRNKRTLAAADIVTVDEEARVASKSNGRPSAEALLHVTIAQRRQAGAILHTHSVWSTILSDAHAKAGGLPIEGYEMLKGLHGVTTHEHREWIPIVENDQERSGHGAARGGRRRAAHAASAGARAAAAPARPLHLGRHAGGRGAARRDSGIPVRGARPIECAWTAPRPTS